MKNEQKGQEAQGAKKTETDNVAEQTKTERKASASYTIKSLKGNIKKFEDLKMATPEELAQLKKVHKAIAERWISIEMGL